MKSERHIDTPISDESSDSQYSLELCVDPERKKGDFEELQDLVICPAITSSNLDFTVAFQ